MQLVQERPAALAQSHEPHITSQMVKNVRTQSDWESIKAANPGMPPSPIAAAILKSRKIPH